MNDQGVMAISHSAAGEEIAWAGICPWTERLCLGTESGHLYFLPDDEGPQPPAPKAYKIVTEPVNGVAFSGDLVGVTSHCEVALSRRGPDGKLVPAERFHSDAHEILALPSGGFVVPLGTDGLLFLTEEEGKITANVGVIDGKRPNFSKVTLLAEAGGLSVLAFAARDSGLIAMTVQGGRVTALVSHEFPGIDVVDVCSLGSKTKPRAAVALNRDGCLLFFSDILEKANLPPVHLGYRCGVPYTVLSAQGHVFVLTSDALVALPDLATRFLRGHRMDQSAGARLMCVQAVEAHLGGDERVFLIERDQAVEFGVADLVGQAADPAHPTAPIRTLPTPAWRTIQEKSMIFRPVA